MNRLSNFFKGAETEFGVFCPKHDLRADLPNFADARSTKAKFNRNGAKGAAAQTQEGA